MSVVSSTRIVFAPFSIALSMYCIPSVVNPLIAKNILPSTTFLESFSIVVTSLSISPLALIPSIPTKIFFKFIITIPLRIY